MLEGALAKLLERLGEGGPQAQRSAKGLIAAVAGRPPAAVAPAMRRLIAEVRAGEEGREGVAAFLEKRSPRWRRPP
jgi:methylglutaconyl-CoA hydratase